MSLPTNINVLVIDDDPNSLQYLTRAMSHAGINISVCTNYAGGIEQINRTHYDAILLDVNFSGQLGLDDEDDAQLAGLTIYDRLRAEGVRSIPVVLFTAFADQPWLRTWLASNASMDPMLTVVHKASEPALIVDHVFNLARIRGLYYAVDNNTSAKVGLCWDQLQRGDSPAIWENAAFLSNKADKDVHKLTKAGSEDRRIQALLFLPPDQDWSVEVLVDVAPWNRYGNVKRELRGVGVICVARLIRERLVRSKQGAMALVASSGAEPFLLHLGFRRLDQSKSVYWIDNETAIHILQVAT